jgi:hypothetical protein
MSKLAILPTVLQIDDFAVSPAFYNLPEAEPAR